MRLPVRRPAAHRADVRSSAPARAAARRAATAVVTVFVATAIIATVTATGCGAGPAAQRAPLNVLLVTLDTTRPDRLGCYGGVRPTSPEIDALAARGVRFERAWSHAPETGPSLATVLTSRRASVTGVRGNAERLDATLPTLATAARAAGLRTAAFVSTALLRRDACAFDRGFDVYDDTMTDPCFGHDRAQRIAPRTADAAIAWLRASDAPSFCWVHLYDPHGPYEPPEPTPALDTSRDAVPSAPLLLDWIPRYQRVGASLDARDYVDRYDREIAVADRHVGRLLRAIDPARTIVVVHADHGEALGEDAYWFRHGNLLHDAALRVPWIVAGPGVPSGRTVAADAHLVDLAPTLLALAAWPPLAAAEGRNLAPVVRGGPAPPAAVLVAEARRREIVRDATGIDTRWKLRIRVAGTDAVIHPGDAEARNHAAWALAEAWLAAPARSATQPAEAPAAVPEDIGRALEGLGYR